MKVSLRFMIDKLKVSGDWKIARAIADHCRFRLGMTYSETVELVRTVWPEMEDSVWAGLMEECDYWESWR